MQQLTSPIGTSHQRTCGNGAEAKLAAETVEEAAEIQAGEVKGFSLFLSSLIASIAKFFKRLVGRGSDEE